MDSRDRIKRREQTAGEIISSSLEIYSSNMFQRRVFPCRAMN